MKSWIMKALCWALSLVILVNILPMQALAADLEQATDLFESENLQLEMDDNASLVDVEVVGEVIENRTEFSKEYQLSNGLSLAVVYPEAVHYQKNGQWEDIDTTLTAKNGMYTTAASPWNVSFPQQLSQNNAITVEMNGHTVSFGMAGELRGSADAKLTLFNIGSENTTLAVTQVQAATAQIETFDYSLEKASAQYPETIPDKLKSRLTYTNVYSNTNVVYDLTAHKLKESVVIARYDAALQGYRYTLNTGDLVPVLNDDQSIALIDPATKEAVLRMPAPYMIDSAGEISNDVEVTLVPNGTAYTLTYRLPAQWVADETRSWPVVLDPVVVPEYYRQNILDQFVAEDYYEDWNHGALYTGYYTAFGKMRTFLQYVNLPELSSSDVIVNATLSLWNHGGNSVDTVVEAHGVNATWDSQTITWANQPSYNSIAEDYAVISSTGRYSWEITALAQKWYADVNTGLMLKAPDSTETGGTDNWKKYYSVDYDVYDSNTWPYLYITFRNTNGLESYWDYTTHSAGRAGTGSVNSFSGNLVWVHNDIGFNGNRMPVSISHIYNANDCGTNAYGLGFGWRINYNQTIEAISNSNMNASYVWT
ncbi:MAG: DNRLRE domain-containing protein, partial [Peptococcaceae bacterium]|nr:DNRLRE domain-containing protein [Peptococcaceae bacterium]